VTAAARSAAAETVEAQQDEEEEEEGGGSRPESSSRPISAAEILGREALSVGRSTTDSSPFAEAM
jgi:hypothetical protein